MWCFSARALALILVLVSTSLRAAEYSTEIHLYNWAFADLGTTQLGGRLGWHNLEVTIEDRQGLSIAVGAYKSFNEGGTLIPRFSLGLQLYGAAGLLNHGLTALIGMGMGFPLFKLFGGKVGLGWDYYVYVISYAGKVLVQPFIPITLSFYF